MGVYSMTGFGKGETIKDNLTLTIEIKSVNHRFKDYRIKMSSLLNSFEMELRKKLDKNFNRGSFDVSVYFKKDKTQKEAELDFSKIKSFVDKMKKELSGESLDIRPTDFLRSEFHVEDEELGDTLIELARDSADKAIAELKKSRQGEGEKLSQTIQSHVENYKTNFKTACDNRKDYEKHIREKLNKKIEEFNLTSEGQDNRYLQEVVYYMEKLDIDEEIGRINIHLDKVNQLLTSKEPIGRQLDFLVQELNRETNTIGSKSGSSLISEAAVQMKVHLEKIREQALNIE